jgi:hypothetical protein
MPLRETHQLDVCFGSKADTARSRCDVRFAPNRGHGSARFVFVKPRYGNSWN